MSTKKYYQTLSFDFPPLVADYELPHLDSPYGQLTVPLELLHSDLVHTFSQIGLQLRSSYLFVTKPFHMTPNIHIDGSRYSDLCAVNWVFGGRGSQMQWFEWSPEARPETLESRTHSTPALLIPPEWCIEVESTSIVEPTLVRVGVPHRVINQTPETRWCLTVRFKNAYNFETAESYLKDHFKK